MLLTAKLVDEVHYNERGNEVFLVKHLDKLQGREAHARRGRRQPEARATIRRQRVRRRNHRTHRKVDDHAQRDDDGGAGGDRRGSALAAEPGARITGEYVEARTAEVFAGGCIMNSEAETMGRQAIMAWKITSGSFDGVRARRPDGRRRGGRRSQSRHARDGRRRADRGEGDHHRRSARHRRRSAMRWCASCARLSRGLITEVVRVDTAPIRFATSQNYVEVSVPDEHAADRQQRDEARPELRRDAVVQAVLDDRAVGDGRRRSALIFRARASAPSGARRTSARPSSARSLTDEHDWSD